MVFFLLGSSSSSRQREETGAAQAKSGHAGRERIPEVAREREEAGGLTLTTCSDGEGSETARDGGELGRRRREPAAHGCGSAKEEGNGDDV